MTRPRLHFDAQVILAVQGQIIEKQCLGCKLLLEFVPFHLVMVVEIWLVSDGYEMIKMYAIFMHL